MDGYDKRTGRKGFLRGAQRKGLCVLCENLRALCVKTENSSNEVNHA